MKATKAPLLLLAVVLAYAFAQLPPVHLDRLRLPAGFSISLLARVSNARQISLNKNETWLFVGSFEEGVVSAVPLKRSQTGDIVAGEARVVAKGLQNPVGVQFDIETGALYASQLSGIMKFDNIEDALNNEKAMPSPVVIRKFPDDEWHGWKYIKIFNDTLLVPQGSPCNICDQKPEIYGTISAMRKTDGGDFRTVARGIRNTVGFDMHPLRPKELWFTDNGRDEWGNDRPGDELNKIADFTAEPKHYGFPYCYEKGLVDPTYNKKGNCDGFEPAQYVLAPHAAALGMTFYRGRAFPESFQDGKVAFIAEHGSWNREVPIAYRVTMVNVTNPASTSYQTFIDGWLNLPSKQKGMNINKFRDSDYAWGRPVDVLNMKDGSLLISDDKAGAIYRVVYGQRRN